MRTTAAYLYKYIFLFVNKKACAAAKYAMNGAIGSET